MRQGSHSERIAAVRSVTATKTKKERDSVASVPSSTGDTAAASVPWVVVDTAAVGVDIVAVTVVMADKQRGIVEGRTFLAAA